jgi:FkbM family methyltransferase
MPEKIIYDLGSNNGDDLPYYLKKADFVVSVEANPELCEEIRRRFRSEIVSGNLAVENVVLTANEDDLPVYFYLSKFHRVHGQLPRPNDSVIDQYDKVMLPSKSVATLIKQYGAPFYVKIDVEHYDEMILRALFQNGIRPRYISSESHSIGVLCALVALGGYQSFKLIDGRTVAKKYSNHLISTSYGTERYLFPMHSAGPFGDDINGEWLTPDNLFRVLSVEGLGWKDTHATTDGLADPELYPAISALKAVGTLFRYVIKPRSPKPLWRIGPKLYGMLR